MRKILIHIQNNALIFSYKRNQTIREDLMNTNIISDSELVFSDDYIETNKRIVMPFFKELCSMNSIDTLVFQNSILADSLIDYFKTFKILTIKIKKEESVPYSFCEKLIAFKTLHELDCFAIANFIMEFLDRHNIKVTTHSEIFYVSPFMQENNLSDYSKLFYKKRVKILHGLSKEDKEDIISFFKINQYLKIVEFYEFHRDDLEFILENLKAFHLKHVLLQLCFNIENGDDILYLKMLNKKYKNDHLALELVYSDEYLKDNFMKQIIINTLKLCSFLLLFLTIGTVGYIFTRNYYAMKEVSSIQEVVKDTISSANPSEIPDKDNEQYVIKNKYIAALLNINPDVVGYIRVNNTNIDYPVVKKQDNKYYLNKNLYQQSDKNGWIFMDFRNSDKILNDNTIIYGHNMYYSGVMFGTLHRALTSSWNTNPDNLVIEFDTMYESMKWQIYSIYTIPKTNDYLKVSFASTDEKNNYIMMTKNRSVRNFDIEVTSDDYLLTLSTCTGDNERLVIHAKRLLNMEA